MTTTIFHSKDLKIAQQIANSAGIEIEQRLTHIRLHSPSALNLEPLRNQYQADFNQLPSEFNGEQIALFVSDMDSTLINIECIDEIADFANIKPQVAKITALAMQGKLDFDSAFIERLTLLKGLDVAVLNQVYSQHLRVNTGVKHLLRFFKSQSIKTAVVSGGFSYFTERLAQDFNLDYAKANLLDVKNNLLTGRVKGDIINAQAKADFVQELCNKQGLSANQVIVAGDGANDLLMMKIASLSVAYHAKAQVIKSANVVINFGGLDKIIDFFDDK